MEEISKQSHLKHQDFQKVRIFHEGKFFNKFQGAVKLFASKRKIFKVLTKTRKIRVQHGFLNLNI